MKDQECHLLALVYAHDALVSLERAAEVAVDPVLARAAQDAQRRLKDVPSVHAFLETMREEAEG